MFRKTTDTHAHKGTSFVRMKNRNKKNMLKTSKVKEKVQVFIMKNWNKNDIGIHNISRRYKSNNYWLKCLKKNFFATEKVERASFRIYKILKTNRYSVFSQQKI